MLLLGLAVDKDVVQKDNYKPITEVSKHLMHDSHEVGGSIGEAKWNHSELILAITSPEGRLVDVGVLNAELMVALLEINLGEDCRACLSNSV